MYRTTRQAAYSLIVIRRTPRQAVYSLIIIPLNYQIHPEVGLLDQANRNCKSV